MFIVQQQWLEPKFFFKKLNKLFVFQLKMLQLTKVAVGGAEDELRRRSANTQRDQRVRQQRRH